jgi:hypothetical protein
MKLCAIEIIYSSEKTRSYNVVAQGYNSHLWADHTSRNNTVQCSAALTKYIKDDDTVGANTGASIAMFQRREQGIGVRAQEKP